MTKKRVAPETRCGNCGAATGSSHANRKYCDACALLSKGRRLPHLIDGARKQMREAMQVKRKAMGTPPFKGHEIQCARCEATFARNGAGQKYCGECAPAAAKERDLRLDVAKRRRSGRPMVGDTLACKQCSAAFVKAGVHQVYCTPECKADWWRANARWTINRRMSAGINGSLRGNKGGQTWQSLVPYDLADLMHHLERQFLPGMTWGNRSEWHVDHLTPLASFSFTSPDDADFKAAWALTNLRPLWALDNIRKSATRTHLL